LLLTFYSTYGWLYLAPFPKYGILVVTQFYTHLYLMLSSTSKNLNIFSHFHTLHRFSKQKQPTFSQL